MRPVGPADVDRLVHLRAQPSVARWWGPPETPGWPLDDDEEEVVLVIEAGGSVAGLIQFGEVTEPAYRSASVDVFLGEDHQRQGLGTDAIRTLCRHLLTDGGHHRITIDPDARNGPAIRTYARVGFRRVGTMRRCWWDHVEERWSDGLLMDLLEGELL